MIGVVGMGAMGSRIAGRLLDTGHPVVVWNRTAGKAAPLVALGAELAATPAELSASSEVVITMLADPAALHATVQGPSGIAAGLAPGTYRATAAVAARTIALARREITRGILTDALALTGGSIRR